MVLAINKHISFQNFSSIGIYYSVYFYFFTIQKFGSHFVKFGIPLTNLNLFFFLNLFFMNIYCKNCLSPLIDRYFPTVNTTVLPGPWLTESMDAEASQMGVPAINYMGINPCIVQGSNVFVFLLRTDTKDQLIISYLEFWCHHLLFSFLWLSYR